MTTYQEASFVFSQPRAQGIGEKLFIFNREHPGLYLYAWPLLVYAREMGMSRSQVIESFDEVCSAIREIDQEWLEKHNKSVIVVQNSDHKPGTSEMLSYEWRYAWDHTTDTDFKYPTVRL